VVGCAPSLPFRRVPWWSIATGHPARAGEQEEIPMSTPHDGPRTAPEGGRYPGEQPPGQPGYGQPGFGPPEYDQAQYATTPYAQQQFDHAGHAQQPYGQHQQYGHPGYGPQYAPPPGYGAAPGYPYGRPTNSLAIMSLVLAFVFAPAGLITGIIARRQIRQTHEDGDGLALAGIIVGGIVTALFVLMIVFWMVAVVAVSNEGFSN
jgi:hypothetical protein